MALQSFENLLEAHLTMQSGCYFSGLDRGPDGTRYLWSALIPDIAWNFGVGLFKQLQFGWLNETATRHGKHPAILVASDSDLQTLAALPTHQDTAPERWMVLDPSRTSINIPKQQAYSIDLSDAPVPQLEFLDIFETLFSDQKMNDHFRTYYIPTLRNAHTVPHVRQMHFVLRVDQVPVSCASIYLQGRLCALYNVGTKHQYQGSGYGRYISARAISQAAEMGSELVFLQCEPDTHVERLYTALGFKVLKTPAILRFANA